MGVEDAQLEGGSQFFYDVIDETRQSQWLLRGLRLSS
jgi:hypothetical protein